MDPKLFARGGVTLERFPGYQDAERLREHGISTVVKVSKGADKVAFEAGKWLVEYAERLSAASPSVSGDRAVVIRELRALFEKVQGAGEADARSECRELRTNGGERMPDLVSVAEEVRGLPDQILAERAHPIPLG